MPEPTNMPTPEEDLPGWIEWMAGITFRDSMALLPKLYVDQGEHAHFRRAYDESTAKRYFLTRCLLDVQMAGCALLRLRDHVRNEEKRDPLPVMTASVIMEQSAWRRRLAEGLGHLILFSTTPTDADYFRCLLVKDAEEARREVRHVQEDFGVSSVTLRRRADDLAAECSARATPPAVWYVGAGKEPHSPSATSVIRAAISTATAAERTALSYSYRDGFAGPSGLMHFSTTTKRRREDLETIRFGVVSIMLLGCAISRRAGKLAALTDELRLLQEPTRTEEIPLPEVGDFVVVTLDRENVFLAEVTGWKTQVGVLGGVVVRYLDGSPYPGVAADELSSDLVQPFMNRRDLLAQVLQQAPEVAEFTSEADRDEAMRRSVCMAWQVAMKGVWLKYLRSGS